MDVDMDGRSCTLKEELEGLREDGELPSLLAVPAVTNDTKLPPLEGSSLNHSKQLAGLCSLHSWSSVGSKVYEASSQSVTDTEPVQEPMDVDMDGRSGTLKEELEGLREDGELPSLLAVPAVTNDTKLPSLMGSSLNHSKQLALISKSILSPVSKVKSPSFKKYDYDSDLMLETDSDLDEPTETETENSAYTQCYEIAEKSWVDYSIEEFILILTRRMNTSRRNMKLAAKVKISMEYPLRPPLFTVNLYSSPLENSSDNEDSEWHNEVRAVEAEVNLHMLKLVPPR